MNSFDIFPWNDNFNIGISEIDEQHQKLVQLLNTLVKNIDNHSTKSSFGHILDDLADYAEHHFQTEESIWQALLSDEPEVKKHQTEHQLFKQKVTQLKTSHAVNSLAKTTEDVLDFMSYWLLDHILESDRLLGYTVCAVQKGMPLEEAKVHAEKQMGEFSGVQSVFSTLSNNAKRLMRQLIENRNAKKTLEWECQKNMAILRNGSDGFHILDLEGNVLEASDSFCSMLGYTRAEVIGMNVARWDGMFDKKDLSNIIHEQYASKQRVQFETIHVRKDGTSFLVEISGSPLQLGSDPVMFYSARNITERKQAEEQLRQREEKLRGLYELSPLGILLTDMQGNFLDFNDAFVKICGYPAEELKSLDYWALTPREYSAQEAAQLEALKTNGRYGPYQKKYIQKDGSRIPVSLNGVLVSGQDGQSCIWSLVEDITAQKQYEAELQQAQADAEAANRAKSAFLANMSHEVRTPLNGVLGFAELLLESDLEENEYQEYAQVIFDSGQVLLNVLNDILDLTDIEAGRVELEDLVFEPGQLIRDATATFAENAKKKGLQLNTDWQGAQHAHYRADPLKLRQMLSNLISNAIKFTPQGFIDIEGRELQAAEGVLLEFSVRDTGIGIPADKQPLLFKPFTQLDDSITRQHEGTGLGLSIVRNLAILMGGNVGIESREGEGTRIWFQIPVDPETKGETDR